MTETIPDAEELIALIRHDREVLFSLLEKAEAEARHQAAERERLESSIQACQRTARQTRERLSSLESRLERAGVAPGDLDAVVRELHRGREEVARLRMTVDGWESCGPCRMARALFGNWRRLRSRLRGG